VLEAGLRVGARRHGDSLTREIVSVMARTLMRALMVRAFSFDKPHRATLLRAACRPAQPAGQATARAAAIKISKPDRDTPAP
jgi:hypothetical protein